MTAKEPHITITFSQLVNNFSNIFKGLAKREGLNDSSYITIGINQIKTFLDEFTTARSVDMSAQALCHSCPTLPTDVQ